MTAKVRQYSLNRRVILFYLIPLAFLLAVLFLYVNVYRTNVETMAQTTFHSLAELKRRQIEENLDELRSITKEIAYSSLLQQYLVETNESEKVQTYAHFQNYLRAISTNSSSIVSAYASLGDFSRVHMADGYLFTFEEAQSQLELRETLDKNTGYFTKLRSLSGAAPGKLYGMYFYVGSPIHAGSIYKDSRMVGGIIYDPSKLLAVDSESADQLACLLIGGKAVSLSGKIGQEQIDTLLAASEQRVTLNGEDYYYSKSELLKKPEMQLLYLVPRESLIQNNGFWEKQTLVFIALAAAVLSLSVLLILQSLFLPIRQLCREVEALKNYGEQLSTPRAKELTAITDTYNAMSYRISKSIQKEKQMVDQQYQLQIQKNRMEMQAFRNQINPHFLFNTLECLNGMVRYYQIEPVSKLITNLSGCFHYSLYSPMMVKLSEELTHLGNYLEIIETRFPGKYRIIRQIDASIEDILVPSLLLQPLAENAVTHAFKGNTKKARPTILLQAKLDETGKYLNIGITDNGVGMDDQKLAEVLETTHSTDYVDKHISLNNVYRRLTLLYGPNCMHISSRSGHYTKISVRIAAEKNRDIPDSDGKRSA
ncbi:MAG: histidine kinase [Clostridia bacterium]|nr:histidine kinase [Clostridia bacterium]